MFECELALWRAAAVQYDRVVRECVCVCVWARVCPKNRHETLVIIETFIVADYLIRQDEFSGWYDR